MTENVPDYEIFRTRTISELCRFCMDYIQILFLKNMPFLYGLYTDFVLKK